MEMSVASNGRDAIQPEGWCIARQLGRAAVLVALALSMTGVMAQRNALWAQGSVLAGPVQIPANIREHRDPDRNVGGDETRRDHNNAQPISGTWTGLDAAGLPVVFVVENAREDGHISVMLSTAGQHWQRGTGHRSQSADQAELHFDLSGVGWHGQLDAVGALHLTGNMDFTHVILSPHGLDEILDPLWPDEFHGAREIALPGPLEPFDPTPVWLQVLIYSPPGPGPHPLAVMHHGATDTGNDPLAFKRVWTHRWLAHKLVSRGYVVAVPQRRGRGSSTGRYDEGLSPVMGGGYSCNPLVALDGFERAMEDVQHLMDQLRALPEVDAGHPSLVLGNSRGGMLALDWAGRHPGEVSAVVNFVGGWVPESCEEAYDINTAAIAEAPEFTGPSLWLYASNDVVYGNRHTDALFETHQMRGGHGQFERIAFPWAEGGHQLISFPNLYATQLSEFLDQLTATR